MGLFTARYVHFRYSPLDIMGEKLDEWDLQYELGMATKDTPKGTLKWSQNISKIHYFLIY